MIDQNTKPPEDAPLPTPITAPHVGVQAVKEAINPEQGFINDPYALAGDLIETLPSMSASVRSAERMAKGSIQPDVNGMESFTNQVSNLVADPTAVMARLITEDSPVLPEEWKRDPGSTRSLLSATAALEAGQLRAQQIFRKDPTYREQPSIHSDGPLGIEDRVRILDAFVGAMQQQ